MDHLRVLKIEGGRILGDRRGERKVKTWGELTNVREKMGSGTYSKNSLMTKNGRGIKIPGSGRGRKNEGDVKKKETGGKKQC